jgi:hypothetical protein
LVEKIGENTAFGRLKRGVWGLKIEFFLGNSNNGWSKNIYYQRNSSICVLGVHETVTCPSHLLLIQQHDQMITVIHFLSFGCGDQVLLHVNEDFR